ncbi:response regulator [Stenotrophomonas sp. 278]|uniref:response regulator n=1 Tax=Stenotrophomonas sp. 278 TaxID=2479851 RepID=UPI000F66CA1A|nr:response regulator [Stenotrophomonas sp. 278]RRU09117.1 response regulator [Stenotrophomonas sp. 278]
MQNNPSPTHPSARILLVEDDLYLAGFLEQAITDLGHDVTHAYSVPDALGQLETGTFDMAVLDVELRDGVVFPVADKLAAANTPYLFASAVYGQLVPVRHQHARFVAKPFHVEELQSAVQELLVTAA